VSILRTVDSVLSIDVTLQMCFTVGGGAGEKPRRPSCVGVVRVLQAQPRVLGVCAPFSGAALAEVHPGADGTWLCVQHEEDGVNGCTCADESI
jgi:hypothetical protein